MKYLCLGPSALGGFAILGFLKAIEDSFNDLEEISGCSSGSLIGLFYLITKSITKTFDIFLEIPIKDITEYSIENLFLKYGFISHDKILNHLRKYTTYTFKELYKETKIKFHVAAFCIEKQMNVSFSVDTHPDLEVAQAVCMSISVPLLVSAYKFGDHHYIDGGTFETAPMSPFLSKKSSDILVVKMSKNDSREVKIENIKDFLKATLNMIISKTEITFPDVPNIYEIPLDDVDIFDFHGMTYEQKVKLFLRGYHRALTHSGLAK